MGTFRDRIPMERVPFAIFSYRNKNDRTAAPFTVTHKCWLGVWGYLGRGSACRMKRIGAMMRGPGRGVSGGREANRGVVFRRRPLHGTPGSGRMRDGEDAD